MDSSLLPDCPTEEPRGCLKCTPTHGCIKCPQLIEFDTRICVEECARGYASQWSTMPDYMGKVCKPNSIAANALFVTVVGITFGMIFCSILVITVIYCLRKRRRRKSIRDTLIDEDSVRNDFLRQLEELRPNAQYFLGMLNDTRRQIRKLHVSGDTMGAQAYRPVVRDLAKILLLVNKPIELLPGPPPDWLRLFMWAQRILDRYKPQMSPLIDFLQSSPTLITDPRLAACQHHTFKSNTTNSTTTSESPQATFGSLISLQDFDYRSAVTLPRTEQLPTNMRSSSNKRHSISDVHNSALWLEDEFFNLGLRPQDEITTEL